MKFDFLLEVLFDFCLPGFEIRVGNRLCPVDAHTEGQCFLVLAREWNQAFIAEHGLRLSCRLVPSLRDSFPRCPQTPD